MKNQLVLICMAVLFTMQTSAQTDSTFYYLDKSGLTNNVLCNFNDTIYWGLYDGVHDKQLKKSFSLQILSDLNHFTFGVNDKPILDSLKSKAVIEKRDNNKIPVFIIHYEYTRIKANALEDSLLTFDEGKYYDVTPRAEEPYETAILFVAQPLTEKLNSGSRNFIISRDFFVSNLPDPSSIEIDFDDGFGYRSVSFGQTITIDYDNNEEKTIKTKITYLGNQFLSFAKTDPEYCQWGYPDVDKRLKISSTIPYTTSSPYAIQTLNEQSFDPNANGLTHASVYIKFGNGNLLEQYRKPLIFIEGIDFGYNHEDGIEDFFGHPWNEQDWPIRNGDVGWCEFWGKSYSTIHPDNYLYGNLEFKYAPDILYPLLAEGYDIMLVDFYDGADFIERNAMIIVQLLNDIQDHQLNGNYAYQPSVVIGASMGGQVAKYALSYMEQNGMKHCTRNFISFDSPHQGANIPLSLQQWLKFFAYNGMGGGDDETRKNYIKRFSRPATRQLLLRQNYVYFNLSPPIVHFGTTDRVTYENTMSTIGYPEKLRKVAVANGSKFGATQQYLSAGQQILDTDWSPSLCINTIFVQGDCFTTGNATSFLGRVPTWGGVSCLLTNFAGIIGTYACALCAQTPGLFISDQEHQSTNIPLWDNAPGGNRNTAEFLASEYNYAASQYGYYGSNNTNIFGGYADPNPTGQPATPRESFIPTISALDVYTNDLTIDINNLITFPDMPMPNIYPFDAYYASATNTPHVQLEAMSLGANSNLVWALNEILNSQPNLPFVLDASSPNSGVYNMARFANRFLGSVTIGNGGSLHFNANMPSDFGSFTSPMPPGGTPTPLQGSTLPVETCDCNGITIDVQSGGEFILGDNSTSNKAIVTLHSGTNFYLRSGAVLRVQEGSQLIVKPGAHFYWESGAEIILEGPNSLIDIQSDDTDIILNSGDVFWLHKGTAQEGGTIIIKDGKFFMYDGSLLDNNHCKIVLLEDVEFTWEDGADFILEEYEAFLDVHYPSTSIILNGGQTFHIQKGNGLHGGGVGIRGGTITMNDGSTIHAEGYLVAGKDNTFNYTDRPIIFCEFDQSFIQFEGVLNVFGATSIFTFSGAGHLKFGLPQDWVNYTNIFTDPGASIQLQGSGVSDHIVTILHNTWISNSIAPFTISDGTVYMGHNSFINIGGDVVLQNIDVTNYGGFRHEGIYVNGQPNHLIDNITISQGKSGLRCRNLYGGSSVTITNSTFYQNYAGVTVYDKGLKFINCNFFENGTYGWSAFDMAFPSSAINCTLIDNGDGSSFTTAGAASLSLEKCIYDDNDLMHGAAFSGSNSLYVRCGSYSQNFTFGINAYNHADLILHPLLGKRAGKAAISDNGYSNILLGNYIGYNQQDPTAINNNIGLFSSAKSLHIEQGYNQISQSGIGSIWPELQLYGWVRECLNINNNQWEPGSPGNISNYSLFGYEACPNYCPHSGIPCNINSLADANPKMRVECWMEPVDDTPLEERSFIQYCPDCPEFMSENIPIMPLNEALLYALDTTTEFDSLGGDDQLAFNMFYEITEFGFYYDMGEVKQIQSIAYNRMKNLFATLGENDPAIFSPGSEQLEKCLYIAERFITFGREYDDDILEYHSYLDMANFHYLAGSRTNAIEYILQIPGCVELDSNLYAFANHRLCFYSAVEEILTGREHIMKFDSLLNRDCFSGFRTGIGLASANIDTVIYSVNPATSPASVTDVNGNIYTSTTVTDSTDNFAVIKTLANNTQDWQFTLDGWNMGTDSAKVITADAAGYIYATGKAWNGYEFNLVTAKINSDGEPVWTAFYNFPGMDATPVGISVDSNFVVSVYTHIEDSSISDYALIKYSQCDTSCVLRIGNIFENVELNNPIASEVFSIYPNPANDVLTIQYSTSMNNAVFQLIDITGRIVIREELNSKEDLKKINISTLPSGIYSAIIVSGDKIQQVNKLAIVR